MDGKRPHSDSPEDPNKRPRPTTTNNDNSSDPDPAETTLPAAPTINGMPADQILAHPQLSQFVADRQLVQPFGHELNIVIRMYGHILEGLQRKCLDCLCIALRTLSNKM